MIERIISQFAPTKSSENASESFRSLHEVIETIDDRLISRDWTLDSCSSCQQVFYKKKRSQIDLCNSYNCAGGYEFLQAPGKRRQSVSLPDVTKRFHDIFTEHGFVTQPPVSIIDRKGNSVFIGNVGQIFDDYIFGKKTDIDHTPAVALQPVIRLQGKDNVGLIDGFTTSFVNMGSEQLGTGPVKHSDVIDIWMNFLSEIGFFMGDFSLKPKLEQTSWGKIDGVQTYTLKFNYRGLEIGVGNYTIIKREAGSLVSQSDLSFGLERVLWALNRNSHFYEKIGPFTNAVRGEDIRMDAYRTTTLMVGSGVYPGIDEQGSKLRMLVERFGGLNIDFNPDLIRFYHNWWSQFTNLANNAGLVIDVLRSESNRQNNVHIQSLLREEGVSAVSKNTAQPVDSFIVGLPTKAYDILRRSLK